MIIQTAKLEDSPASLACDCLKCCLRRNILLWHAAKGLEINGPQVVERLAQLLTEIACLANPDADDIKVYVLGEYDGPAEGDTLQ